MLNVCVLLFCSSFKLFLELEPQLRDIIHKFYESKYASCLKLLDEIKVSVKKYIDKHSPSMIDIFPAENRIFFLE